jgi:hypothetical protein
MNKLKMAAIDDTVLWLLFFIGAQALNDTLLSNSQVDNLCFNNSK